MFDHKHSIMVDKVTGWALDGSGIDSVKIYREQGDTLVYIGEGVFVEGARPDVAAAYPDYPNKKTGTVSHDAAGLTRRRIKINKSFCGGSRGVVFSF
jgi:hypothetical protein